jgi:hypothetical protein
VVVAKLDRLSRDVAFVAGLMAQRVPFIDSKDLTFTELGNPRNVFNVDIKQYVHTFKVGLNYRFGGPSVGRY